MTNAMVLILIALRYIEAGHASTTIPGIAFAVAMYIAHASSMAMVLWLPALLTAFVWPQRHVVVTVAVAIGTGITALLFADTVVFQQYRFHINSALLALFFSDASAETFEFSIRMKLEMGGLLVSILLGQYLLAHLVWIGVQRTRYRSYGYVLATILVVVFIGTNLFHAYADATGDVTITRQTRLLPLFEPLTARGFLKDHGFDIAERPQTPTISNNGSFDYPRQPLSLHEPDKKPNIVIIAIDSWRFDAMTKDITPNIYSFAQDNIYFKQHFSGGNATRMGIFTLFYGIPGPYWFSALETRTRSALIERLDDLDYQFGIYRSAALTSPEFDRTVFAGMHGLRMRSEGQSSPQRDIDATQDFLNFLDERDSRQPFFGFVFYDSPHAYDLPDEAPMPFQPSWESVNFLALDQDTNPVPFFNLYKNSVHFVDGLVGKILAGLHAKDLMDDTIVIITGDHGQEFNDTGLGFWGHNSNYSRYQTKVPFIVHWPGKMSKRINYFTSHFDVAATIMKRLLGVDNAFHATSVGHDLFDNESRLPIIMAKYRGYAAYTGERFIVFPLISGVEVRGTDYRLINDASPSGRVIRKVLAQLSLFRSD